MTASFLVKPLLILAFIPLAYALTWACQRWLPPENPLREYVERNGKEKVARHLILTVYAIGGTVLTIVYS